MTSQAISCVDLRNRLGNLLEGEAEPAALAHLESCARCQVLVDELGALSRAASQLPVREPSPELWRRIRRQAEREGLLEPNWGLRLTLGAWQPAFSPGLALAAVALLVAGVLLVGYPGLEVSPARSEPANRIEIARSELALTPTYGERYALHLASLEATMREEVVPASPSQLPGRRVHPGRIEPALPAENHPAAGNA
jgi:hypothetical protein